MKYTVAMKLWDTSWKKQNAMKIFKELSNNEKYKIFPLLTPLLWCLININGHDNGLVYEETENTHPSALPPSSKRRIAPYILNE